MCLRLELLWFRYNDRCASGATEIRTSLVYNFDSYDCLV